MTKPKSYLLATILITSLFFFWGFIHNLDPILLKHLRSAFSLTHLEASLVDSAVFVAYFLLAIPAGLIMQKYGYKAAILVGLSLFALGCFLFVPAANTISYPFFLGALFVLSCGLTILETAANPYITVLGDPATATRRLNFAQSFNGLAACIAPLLGGLLILKEEPKSAEEVAALNDQARELYIQTETALVKGPYIVLGVIILAVAILFFLIKLPEIKDEDESNNGGLFAAFKAFRHKNVRWGVVAQFFYVGAQVYILSFLLVYVEDILGIKENIATYSFYAGLLFMIGRFVGTFFMKYIAPNKLLAIYSLIAAVLTLVIVFGTGLVTLYALLGVAFFMSIMFPTIFAMGIEGVGTDTKSASSLIIMSIVGGAVIPPVAGWISDVTDNMQYSYLLIVLCFMMIYFFATSHKSAVKVKSEH